MLIKDNSRNKSPYSSTQYLIVSAGDKATLENAYTHIPQKKKARAAVLRLSYLRNSDIKTFTETVKSSLRPVCDASHAKKIKRKKRNTYFPLSGKVLPLKCFKDNSGHQHPAAARLGPRCGRAE